MQNPTLLVGKFACNLRSVLFSFEHRSKSKERTPHFNSLQGDLLEGLAVEKEA